VTQPSLYFVLTDICLLLTICCNVLFS